MAELQLLDAFDARVEPLWRRLENAAASPSYFLSWGWIENWLACLPADERPQLAVIRDRDEPAAAFFLGARKTRRHLAFGSRALYLNATGDPRHDGLRVEHNGILRAPSSRISLDTVISLLPESWDELYLPAVDRAAFPDLSKLDDRDAFRVRIDRDLPAPFVDLDTVRSVDGGYLALLSSTTRAQIRRARREVGEMTIEVAGDERHAMDIYAELVRLHARRWHMRGERGAFGDPWFDQFHRRLICNRLLHGEIQLLRISAGGHTIGCLYNLIHRGRVLFYQSGLAQFDDPHIKPGYLCHAEAVELNAAVGMQIYDLLGGNARYMHSLSTNETRLLWLRIQRRRARFVLEDRLKEVKHAVTSWRQRRLIAGVPSRA